METIKSFQVATSEDIEICPIFSFYQQSSEIQEHLKKVKQILLKMLPDPLPFTSRAEFEAWLKEGLPLLTWDDCTSVPSLISLRLLTPPLHSLPTETFFYEMVRSWLMPNEELQILTYHHLDFYFKHHLKEPFFVAEAQILIKSPREGEKLAENLPFLKEELFSVLKSRTFSRSILATKNLPVDRKTLLVRESLLKLIKRFPDDFDDQILHRFALAQAVTTYEFKNQRGFPHLTRLIASMYLIRMQLDRELRSFPEKRHIMMRFIQTKLTFAFGAKPVLGLVIGLNLFHPFEFFDQKHILLSVQKFFPHMRLVSGSFQRFQPSQNPIVTLYIEFEKEDGSRFFPRELRVLRDHLEEELSKRIEQLVPTLFMVKNEEEVMRNILMLSRELKNPDDPPQMMISFDHHSQEDLIFKVVLLRIKNPDDPPLQTLLNEASAKVRFIPDRVQFVRFIDGKHPIEANVFRLQMDKLPSFLRMDFSVNLYLARQEVVTFLNQSLGELRDYNGGLILKQGELLTQFKRLFQDLPEKKQELLEDFFYSLSPIEAQATIPLNCLSFFFDLFLEFSSEKIREKKNYEIKVDQMEGGKFVVVHASDESFQPLVEKKLSKKELLSRSIVSSSLIFDGGHYLGYFIPNCNQTSFPLFEEEIRLVLSSWVPKKESIKTLKIATPIDVNLDPRLRGDMNATLFTKLLFEGLMRKNAKGKLECAIAESYTVSDDQLRYIFKLKKTQWSDGSPLVAYDFEYAWKKIISSSFETSFLSFFSPIKHARKVKRGEALIDAVGIHAPNDQTLIVDLEYPTPYFIELTAHALYSPVSHHAEKMHPDRYIKNDSYFICNGPYWLKPSRPIYSYELEKNPYFWNPSRLYFDCMVVNKMKAKSCIEMFKKKNVDFVNFPFQSLEDYQEGYENLPLHQVDSEKISWICLNTQKFPFYNTSFRLALSAALSRAALACHPHPFYQEAHTPLPKGLTQHLNAPFLVKENQREARHYLEKALKELSVKHEEMPRLILNCNSDSKKELAKAIKEQWEAVLGLQVEIDYYDALEHFNRMASGTYQIGFFKWQSLIRDPMYTLDAFRYRDDKMNFPNWENPMFQRYLHQAEMHEDKEKRLHYLALAEKLLIEESPMIPLFYDRNIFLKSPSLVIPEKLLEMDGSLDLSQACLDCGCV